MVQQHEQLLPIFLDRLDAHISISPDLRAMLYAHITIRTMHKGYAVHGHRDDLHVVLEGLVVKEDESRHILEFVPSGDFFLHMDTEEGTFTCKEPSVIATLSPDSAYSIIQQYPVFYKYVQMIYRTILDKRILRAKLLSKPIRQRKELFYRMHPEIASCRPMYEVASYLGCNANYFGSI